MRRTILSEPGSKASRFVVLIECRSSGATSSRPSGEWRKWKIARRSKRRLPPLLRHLQEHPYDILSLSVQDNVTLGAQMMGPTSTFGCATCAIAGISCGTLAAGT